MDFSTLFYETLESENYFGTREQNETKNFKENPLASLALNVIKRDTEKTALLRLKGFERVDIERSKGKHSVVCRHWLKGMCMKGEFCDFLHQLVYSRMPPCKTVEKNSFCVDKLKGCCIFKHANDEDQNDQLATRDLLNAQDYTSELSYLNNHEKFTQAFNSAMLFAFPKIADYN